MVFQITLLTAVDTIPIVSTVTCTRKTSICVVTVCISVTVVYWIGLIAFIDIFTGESISKIACVTAAVIAPNVVCAGSVYITLICPSCTLINICMHVKTCVIWKSGSITSHQHNYINFTRNLLQIQTLINAHPIFVLMETFTFIYSSDLFFYHYTFTFLIVIMQTTW